MENASLVSLSRQVVLRRQMDITADNVANMNTTGFKRELLNLTSTSLPPAKTNAFPKKSDRIDKFVTDWKTTTMFDQGAIQASGNPLDVAISGPAFFAVQTPGGERYTRAGAFTINNQGQLVTYDNHPVLTTSGPITFDPNEKDVVISRDGTIATANGVKGQLKLVTFSNLASLQKIGQNMFSGNGAQPASSDAQVIQGAIENSNVRPVEEMTRMIDITRSYEALANMMKKQDDMRSKAIDQLGRLSA